MRRTVFALLLAMLLLLTGCSGQPSPGSSAAPGTPEAEAAATTEATVPATVPADGNSGDVTCLGSYTAEIVDATVARVGDAALTNEDLQVWYWAEVARYRQEGHEASPDFDRPLDTQVCEIDSSVNSWQQYFLKQALNAWHNAQALLLHSQEVPLPTEAAYQPNLENHEKYLVDQPATKVLYGYNPYYSPNSMHQEYLDTLPQTLDDLAKDKGFSGAVEMAQAAFGTSGAALNAYANTYNRAYMYFTQLSYYIEPTEEELAAFYEENKASYDAQGKTVDIRHLLLVPEDIVEVSRFWSAEPTEPKVLEEVFVAEDGTVTCSEEAWAHYEKEAQELLTGWKRQLRTTEYTFAEMAHAESDDAGTALDGGRYQGIRQGQLIEELDAWCFEEGRAPGDTAILRSPYGVHILYYCGGTDTAYEDAAEDYYRLRQEAILTEARESYPMEVTYASITLAPAEASVSSSDLLYADVAHERFPEIPLYLQQDYPDTMYGNFKITTHGCGITTMAMLASYMSDEELTPPEMCERFGDYCYVTGTDGMLYNYEPSGMGFYLREKTYDPPTAYAALEEGQIVISIQNKGYWTRGGHYIALEKLSDDGRVQVRDSNIFNYGRLQAHLEDLHKWSSITPNCSGYWIYEDKITAIPACTRCGVGSTLTGSILTQDYFCHKCQPAMLRRDSYLNG